MIAISQKYSISRKHEHFISYEHDESGEVCASMEHPSLIDLHSSLKSLGECGEAIMIAASELLEGAL